jgi:hypothetical protein
MDREIDCLLLKIKDKGRGENVYMAPQSIISRQTGFRSLVIGELNMTVDLR